LLSGEEKVANQLCILAHLTRHHHRIKTHAPGWRTWQLDDHTHLWRTPHGRYRLVDQTGTHPVGVTTDTGPPPRSIVIELWRAPARFGLAPDYRPSFSTGRN
jgi:hypothetical protein